MKRKIVTVILICAFVLLVAALKRVRRLQTTSPRYHCITALKQIDGAKATWALDHHKRTEDVPTWNELLVRDKYLQKMPVCPQAGAYTIGSIAERPRCSIPEHTL